MNEYRSDHVAAPLKKSTKAVSMGKQCPWERKKSRSMISRNIKLFSHLFAGPRKSGSVEWEELLERISEHLTTLINDTEPEFLKIGGELERFFGTASELLKKADAATLSNDGRSIQDILDQVRSIFNNALKRLNTISHAMSQFRANIFSSDAMEQNNKLLNAQKALTKQAKITEIIWILIKITSGGLKGGGSDFVALVEQLGKLSHRTRTNAERLSEQIKENQRVFCEIDRSLDMWMKREKEEGEKLFRTIKGTLDLLSKASSKLIRLSGRVQDRSVYIKQHLGEIISAIQFQDITRQQVEHVQKSIKEMRHSIILRRKFRENGSLSWLCTTANVQIPQLENVAKSIANAGKQLKKGLSDIAGDCKEQYNDVVNAFEVSEQGSEVGVLDSLQIHTQSLREFFHESVTMNSDLLNTVRKISEATGVMEDSLNNIRKTHMDMTIVAMNAQVGSATLGEEGRALSVLAEEITRLSKISDTITETATHSIKRILSFVNHVDSSLTESLNKDREKTEEINKDAGEALALLADTEARTKRAVTELGRESNDLADQIMAMVDSIQFIGVTRSYIERAVKKINNFVEDVQTCQTKIKRKKHSAAIDPRIRTDYYTMETERDIHKKTLNLADEAGGRDTISKREDNFCAEQPNNPELGDNVELF